MKIHRIGILDLFAGIGGFSLAGHWLGWETVAFVEWDKFCQGVLKKNFPGIPIYGDIKKFNELLRNGEIITDTTSRGWGNPENRKIYRKGNAKNYLRLS